MTEYPRKVKDPERAKLLRRSVLRRVFHNGYHRVKRVRSVI